MAITEIYILGTATIDPGGVMLNYAMFGCGVGTVAAICASFFFFLPKHGQSSNQSTATNGEVAPPKKHSYPPLYIMGGAIMADVMGGGFGGSLGASAGSQSLVAAVAGGTLGAFIGEGGVCLMFKLHDRLLAKGYFNFQPNKVRYSHTVVRTLATFCIMLLIPTACAVLALALGIALFQPSLFHSF